MGTGHPPHPEAVGFKASEDHYAKEQVAKAEPAPPGVLTLAKKTEDVLTDLSKQAGFPLRLVLFVKKPEKR